MRHEQDLLTRRKQAMLSQLTSLSALAVETAESLPEVPELDLDDHFTEPEQPPASEPEGSAADQLSPSSPAYTSA